jgi:hypothetical protein
VLLELASKAQELISCLVWLNWHPWGVSSLLIVVILDGALPSTVSGTLTYAECSLDEELHNVKRDRVCSKKRKTSVRIVHDVFSNVVLISYFIKICLRQT